MGMWYCSCLRHYAARQRSQIPFLMRSLDISPNLSNPSSHTLALGLTQPLNRNEYQEFLWGVKRGQRISLKTSPLSVSRLSRQCGILNISQPYRSPRPVTGIALLFSFYLGAEECAQKIQKQHFWFVVAAYN
jgi:hypothetical protein